MLIAGGGISFGPECSEKREKEASMEAWTESLNRLLLLLNKTKTGIRVLLRLPAEASTMKAPLLSPARTSGQEGR